MEINKILSAPWLDILFDNRNKDYGAYELRRSYSKRIGKALFITIIISALVFAGTTLAGSVRKGQTIANQNEGIMLTEIEEKKLPEKLPEPERRPEPEPVKTQKFVEIAIVPDDEFDKPTPTVDDFMNHKIDIVTNDVGSDYKNLSDPTPPGNTTGIITAKIEDESDKIETIVQVESRFIGDWIKFLRKNLDPQVPVNNDAPPGRYTVVIQFVVDKEGNVSDIKPLTSHGYGLEEEAVRVLKKATKWEPAIQNGYKVKAYHRQPIVFEVLDEE